MTESESASVRRLGDGYEPHVDEDANGLTYSLPVDSGHFSTSFSFAITPADLDVLESDRYRRAVLFVVAYTVLQRSMIRGQPAVTPEEFDALVAAILHAPSADVEAYITRIDRDYNQVTRLYVDKALARDDTEER
jgi:hypothetical protein